MIDLNKRELYRCTICGNYIHQRLKYVLDDNFECPCKSNAAAVPKIIFINHETKTWELVDLGYVCIREAMNRAQEIQSRGIGTAIIASDNVEVSACYDFLA